MNNQISIKKNFIFNLVRTFLSLVFPIITFAYASRILGKTGIGKVNFAASIVSYFTLFASLGISNYGVREGARVRDDKDKLSKLVQELLVINLCTTCITYIVFFIVIFKIESIGEYKDVLLIQGLSIGLTSLGMDWLYAAVEDYKYITLRQSVFQIIALILMVLLVKDRTDYNIYAALVVLSGVGANILNFVHIRQYISFEKRFKLKLKKHLKSVSILFFYSLSVNLYNNIDSVMLGLMIGDASVGLYSAASKMNRMVITMLSSLGTVLIPRLSYYIEKNKFDEFQKLLKKSFNFIMLFSIPAAIGLWLLGKEIIFIFSGQDFIDAVTTMRILIPIICVIPMTTIVNCQILIPSKREKNVMISTLIGGIVNFILNSILIPKYADKGAAFASVCAEVVVLVVALSFVWREYDIYNILKDVWKYILASISIVFVFFITHSIFKNIYIITATTVIGAVITYFLCLLMLRNEYVLEFFEVILKKVGSEKNER